MVQWCRCTIHCKMQVMWIESVGVYISLCMHVYMCIHVRAYTLTNMHKQTPHTHTNIYKHLHTHPDTPTYKQHRIKDQETTQSLLGFKVCGMQVYRQCQGGYWRCSKRWCKKMPEGAVDKALWTFAHNGMLRRACCGAVWCGVCGQVLDVVMWWVSVFVLTVQILVSHWVCLGHWIFRRLTHTNTQSILPNTNTQSIMINTCPTQRVVYGLLTSLAALMVPLHS